MNRELDQNTLKSMFVSAAHHLDNNKEAVNDLNVFPVPDGDTGTNMSMTMQSAVRALHEKEFANAGEVAAQVASATLRGARGNSGVILSQIMRGFSVELAGCVTIKEEDVIRAVQSAAKTAYRAVMEPTEGTILTVIRCTAEELASLDMDGDIESLFEAIVRAAQNALDETPKMLPVLKKAGVVDAGGKGLVLIFEGMLAALKSGEIVKQINTPAESTVSAAKKADAEIKFGYCTEFIIRKKVKAAGAEELKKTIAPRGDNVLVIDDDDIIKVHIHTNHPGWVMERALDYGMLSDIKVDNLREQHAAQVQKTAKKPVGVIAVCAGKGIADLFYDMGVDVVVSGGQTMNPSTDDILEAIEELHADKIIILPNNGNIVLTAEQAAKMSDKNIEVIKTKTIPQGISAMLAFDSAASAPEKDMAEAAAGVMTGLLTNAVRDTEMDGMSIAKDDYLALLDGNIVAADKDEKTAFFALSSKMISEESFAVTVLYGEGVSESEAQAYVDAIAERWPETEVTLIFGGQPVYKYILSVE